jgi:signal peptidase I
MEGSVYRMDMERGATKNKRFFKEYVEPIVIAILIALFIRAFIVQAFKIPSSSMEPTLLVGDHILVSKFIFGIRIPFTEVKLFQWNKPKRGDVIVFIFPLDRTKDFIKRVIGTEGDKVDIVRNKILINGQEIEDPWGVYIDRPDWVRFSGATGKYEHTIVPKDHIFVLGDNRDNSQDSRYWGFVDIKEVKGKAFTIYFSWNSNSEDLLGKIRWSRFAKLIR